MKYQHHPKYAAPDVVGCLSDALDALEVVPRRFSPKAEILTRVLHDDIQSALKRARLLQAEIEATADWENVTNDEARDAEARHQEQT